MADIRKEIEAFREAIYGEEIRDGIISLAEKVNGESEEAVATSEENARTAAAAAQNAQASAETASEKAREASESAASITGKREEAAGSAADAARSAGASEEHALLAKSYAIGTDGEAREGDGTDNSRYYYEQSRRLSEGLQGGLLPMGTVTFEELGSVSVGAGYMYNISNAFTSDDRFKDGGGIQYGAGSNAYYTADGMWDVLAAPGAAESSRGGGISNLRVKGGQLAYTKDGADTVIAKSHGISVGWISGVTPSSESGNPGEIFNFENNVASGWYSHAEGANTKASGSSSHTEGSQTTASGNISHAEGFQTKALGVYSHAEGNQTTASGSSSHAEGNQTEASGDNSHAEGFKTTASKVNSHAEGGSTKASGSSSHAEGSSTTASGSYSHAEGNGTTASAPYSHAGGFNTTASKACQTAIGSTNKPDSVGYLIIGGAPVSQGADPVNAFRVTQNGSVYAKGAYNSSGADYAEFIYEWEDGNPDNEDRVGYFVTCDNQKIRIAGSGDSVDGIISGAPSVVGSGDEDWLHRFERDAFNRVIYDEAFNKESKHDEQGRVLIDENGDPVMEETDEIVLIPRQVKDYDPERKYVERKDRPEWDYVGMLGVIAVRDDGTCIPGKFCKCNNGIATLSQRRTARGSWKVIERVADNVVKVLFHL